MSMEAEFHKQIKPHLNKRQQAVVMSAFREVSAVPYDRKLIADMLTEYERHAACDTDLVHLETDILKQARLIRETK